MDIMENQRDIPLDLFFTDFFNVSVEILEEYGAYNISLVTDLPLFIDPFLLFNSENKKYKELHDNIIKYLLFLKDKSTKNRLTKPYLKAWFYFSEIKQNWLGFCEKGNKGHGFGRKFAEALKNNLKRVFENFGIENITQGSHLEKLCLFDTGIGRDMISDFTTNLIKDYLLNYTTKFAEKLDSIHTKNVSVDRAYFSYDNERWMPKTYLLPIYNNDFVLLTPKNILTKDDTWISRKDMINRFLEIPNAIENTQLRAIFNNYVDKEFKNYYRLRKDQIEQAINIFISAHPEILDYYIRLKEQRGNEAVFSSNLKVNESEFLYILQFGKFANFLQQITPFFKVKDNTKKETREKIIYLKNTIENNGGYKYFFDNKGVPIRREQDIHILFRLLWHGSPSDVSGEVNNGRGPVDFAISRGAKDKTLVEFKLASNTKLKRNLEKQLEIYMESSKATAGYKVIFYFTSEELDRVHQILKELNMQDDENIILIDACPDNKPSASRA